MARRKKPTDPQDMASIAERRDLFAARDEWIRESYRRCVAERGADTQNGEPITTGAELC